jgi:hypothetical protein
MSGTLINFKDKTFPSAHKHRYIRYLLKQITQKLQTLCTSSLLYHIFLQKTDLWKKCRFIHIASTKYYSVLPHSLQFQVKKEDLITVANAMLKNTPL